MSARRTALALTALLISTALAPASHAGADEAGLTLGDLPDCPTGSIDSAVSDDPFLAEQQHLRADWGLTADALTLWGTTFGDEDGFGDFSLEQDLRPGDQLSPAESEEIRSIVTSVAPGATSRTDHGFRDRFGQPFTGARIDAGPTADLRQIRAALDAAGYERDRVRVTSHHTLAEEATILAALRDAGLGTESYGTRLERVTGRHDQQQLLVADVLAGVEIDNATDILCADFAEPVPDQPTAGQGWRLLAAADVIDTREDPIVWEATVTSADGVAAVWPFDSDSERLVGSSDLPTLSEGEVMVIASPHICIGGNVLIDVGPGAVRFVDTPTGGTDCPGFTPTELHRTVAIAVDLDVVGPDITTWVRYFERSRHVAQDGEWVPAGILPAHGGHRLVAPIVDAIAAPDGGAWWVGPDGGVFALWGADFYGSLGSLVLDQPIVGGAATPSGEGYWLVASDGGVFAFGDARFHGSVPGVLPSGASLDSPIVGIEPTATGDGYWLAAADGGVFTFGDAEFVGSLVGSRLGSEVVGIGRHPNPALKYVLVTSSGEVWQTIVGRISEAPMLVDVGDFPATDVVIDATGAVWVERGAAPAIGSVGADPAVNPIRARRMTCPAGEHPLTVEDPGYLNLGDRRLEAALGQVAIGAPSIFEAVAASPGLADGIWLFDGAYATNALEREQVGMGLGTRTSWAIRQGTICVDDPLRAESVRVEARPEITPFNWFIGTDAVWTAERTADGWAVQGQSGVRYAWSFEVALVGSDFVITDGVATSFYYGSGGGGSGRVDRPIDTSSVVLTRIDDDVVAGQLQLDFDGVSFWAPVDIEDDPGLADGDVALGLGMATVNEDEGVSLLRRLIVVDVDLAGLWVHVFGERAQTADWVIDEILGVGDSVGGTSTCVLSIDAGVTRFGACPV